MASGVIASFITDIGQMTSFALAVVVAAVVARAKKRG